MTCPKCGGAGASAARVIREMMYADRGAEVPLRAEVTEYACAGCGERWLADDAKAAFEAQVPAAAARLARRWRVHAVLWTMCRVAGSSLPLAAAITLVVLKWRGVIGWAWVWVTAPVWIPICIAVIAVVVMFVAFVRSPHH